MKPPDIVSLLSLDDLNLPFPAKKTSFLRCRACLIVYKSLKRIHGILTIIYLHLFTIKNIKNQSNVGKYTIHGWYGYVQNRCPCRIYKRDWSEWRTNQPMFVDANGPENSTWQWIENHYVLRGDASSTCCVFFSFVMLVFVDVSHWSFQKNWKLKHPFWILWLENNRAPKW